MPRLISIAAELSAPPSEPLVFRDFCLYASVFKHYEVVALSESDMIDAYARWFARYGLWDFVLDLLPPDQIRPDEVTIEVEGGADARLTVGGLAKMIAAI